LGKNSRKDRFAGENNKRKEKYQKPLYKLGQVVLIKEVLFSGNVEYLSRGPWWGTITDIDKISLLYRVLPIKQGIVSLPCKEDQILDVRKEEKK